MTSRVSSGRRDEAQQLDGSLTAACQQDTTFAAVLPAQGANESFTRKPPVARLVFWWGSALKKGFGHRPRHRLVIYIDLQHTKNQACAATICDSRSSHISMPSINSRLHNSGNCRFWPSVRRNRRATPRVACHDHIRHIDIIDRHQ